MKTILIIDEAHYTESLINLIQNNDRKILWAKSEDEVIKYFNNNKIDVVLLDPLMSMNFLSRNELLVKNPEIGGVGYILLFNIRKEMHPAKGGVKLILYTSVSQKSLIEFGFSDNTPYLRKPISYKEVIDEINK